MATWPSLLIPAVSALLGTVTGSGLTFWGQALADRRVDQRERESRREAFHIQRYEKEQATLTDLAETLEEHGSAWLNIIHFLDRDKYEKFEEVDWRLRKICSRITNQDLYITILNYRNTITSRITVNYLRGDTIDDSDKEAAHKAATVASVTLFTRRESTPYDSDPPVASESIDALTTMLFDANQRSTDK